MLKALEGTLNAEGTIRFDEAIELVRPHRVLVTLLDTDAPAKEVAATLRAKLQTLLASPEFRNRPTGSAEALEALVEQNRNAWES